VAIKLAGYTRVERSLEGFHPTADYVILSEHLERESARIILPPRGNATTGTVVSVADGVLGTLGLTEGDDVLFAEWQGGRWSFLDESKPSGVINVLIMTSDDILAKIRKEEED
jgi:co-chaperonin GroES (HSP10)